MNRPGAAPVYLAAHPLEAQLVADFLAAHGVHTRQQGAFAWGAMGEIPMPESYPRLYLQDERDRERAQALLREYERGAGPGQRDCPACGEASPAIFARCWSCGGLLE